MRVDAAEASEYKKLYLKLFISSSGGLKPNFCNKSISVTCSCFTKLIRKKIIWTPR